MAMNRVGTVEDIVPLRHVLVSVYDKSRLETLIPGILDVFPECLFYSTGGTFKGLSAILGQKHADSLKSVSDFTGQPEMQGGLVKTLDFKIYLGLLSEPGNDAHGADIKRVEGVEFDAVVGNLYPFSEVVQKETSDLEDARGNIDIGGPCMIRASAKNYLRVLSMCDPGDYEELVKHIAEHNGTTLDFRFRMAAKAFAHTAAYDTAIAGYLHGKTANSLRKTYTS